MRTVAYTFAAILAVAVILLPVACSASPGYDAAVRQYETRIHQLEEGERAVAQEIKTLREERARHTAAMADLEGLMAEAAPDKLAQFQAEMEALRDAHGLSQAAIDQLKTERAMMEGERRATEAGLRDYKVNTAGEQAGGWLQLVMTLLGLGSAGGLAWAGKAMSVVNQLKAAPSRAQAAVDDLWDDASAKALEIQNLKGQLQLALARLDQQVKQPPASAIPPALGGGVATGQTAFGSPGGAPPPA